MYKMTLLCSQNKPFRFGFLGKIKSFRFKKAFVWFCGFYIRLGFFINAGCFDIGLKIYHYGSIIVNPKSRIGKNCTIHGNCCIGSKGTFPDDSPVIGNNVDIGQNAQILGGIYIADGVKIGAGAVVTKSVLVPGVTVVGVPARIVEK